MDPAQLIETLQLAPLPSEGGYFRRTYTDPAPDPQEPARPRLTTILYLITPESYSALHRLRATEIFFHLGGGPAQMLQLTPDGRGQQHLIGPAPAHNPQITVPGQHWQGLHLTPGSTYALFGITVVPGFIWEDFELGNQEQLTQQYPAWAEEIGRLT